MLPIYAGASSRWATFSAAKPRDTWTVLAATQSRIRYLALSYYYLGMTASRLVRIHQAAQDGGRTINTR